MVPWVGLQCVIVVLPDHNTRENTIIILSISLEILLSKDGPRNEKTCLRAHANNTGANQPVYLRSLIVTFVIRFFGKFHM